MGKIGNVSTVLQEKVRSMEGGRRTTLLSSGMIAIYQTITTLARAGDEIVVSANLRPEVYDLFNIMLRDMGVTINFVQSAKAHDYIVAISPRTRFIFLDAEGGLVPQVFEISEIAYIAHKYKIPLVVDAGGMSPHFKPLELGADIVIRDFELLCGTRICTGGAVTEAGNFDWRTSNVLMIKAGDPCCNGIRWAFDLPKEDAAVAFSMRLQHVMTRIFSSSLSDPSAFYIWDNIENIFMRCERKYVNAMAVAKLLEKSDEIAWVAYPPLTENCAKAKVYGKCNTSVGFAFKGTKEESLRKTRAFFERLQNIVICPQRLSNQSAIFALGMRKNDSLVSYSDPSLPPLYENSIRFIAGIEETSVIRKSISNALKGL